MDRMKDYRQLLKELPPSTLVCAFGEFDPPTTGHELLVKTVKRLSEQKHSDHVIFTSPSKSLTEEKKEHYLNLMFPKTKFKSLEETKFTHMVNQLNEKYKKIIVVAGTNQLNELKKLNNIEVITITEDTDSDKMKMKQAATKGIYENFKKKLPSTIRELDGRRLMNDVRNGLGLEPVKEQILLVKDMLREQYFRGEIFNEGDLVESDGVQYTIAKRGSNHLLLKEKSGELVSKWIHDVQLIENHTLVAHNKDHKELSHGADFSMKIGKEHHGKINGLQHGDQHEFKCMAGNEWTVAKQGDNLRFTGHKLDTNISSNIAFHVPANHFSGEEEMESPNMKNMKGFSKILLDKQQNTPEKLTPQERTLLRMITKSGGGNTEISEGTIQTNGTDKIESGGPNAVDNTTAPAKPAGKKKGFMTFYNYNTKDDSDFKVVKAEQKLPMSKSDTDKDNESDLEKLNQIELVDTGSVGHSLVGNHAGSHHLRRQKVNYGFREEKETKAVKKLKSFKDATGSGYQNNAGGSGSNVMSPGTGVGASGGGVTSNESYVNEGMFADDESIARELVKKHGKGVNANHIRSAVQNHPQSHKTSIERVAGHVTKMLGGSIKEETTEQADDRKKQLKRFKDQILPQQVQETKLNPADVHSDYKAKSKALQDIQMDPNTHKDPQMKDELIKRKAALDKEYEPHKVQESRGHKIVANFLKKRGAWDTCPKCGKSPCQCNKTQDRPGTSTENNPVNDPFFK
jgi:hypothetical protein